MKKTLKILITASVAIITIALLPFYINLLTNNEEVIKYSNSLGFFRLTVIVGVMILLALALTLWLTLKQDTETSQSKNNLPENIEPDVKKFHDSLKERYQKRYESKLDGRFEIKLEVSENWDGNKTQTFTERYDKDAKISEAFPRLKELFEQKDGLLIVGEPGAGKTVLLLKVALNLLEKTNLAEKEPFPVIFNLASWNEEYKDFGEWLKAMLVSGNGLSNDFAARLLHEKRFILLLDGLDELARNEEKEIAETKRAACLEALNKYLDGEKTVICCRIDEFVEMQKNTAQDAPVSAKIKVLNLTEVEVIKALGHAQTHPDSKHHASAKNLSELIVEEENAALRKILCTPFYFTIALEVFYKRLPAETNLPHDKKELSTYLIEKYVERKLEKTPNPNNFENEKTKKWLGWMADLMENKNLITFELADLQPTDLIKSWHFGISIGVVRGLFKAILSGFFFGIFFGLSTGIYIGYFVGLFAFIFGWIFGLQNIKTEDVLTIKFSFESVVIGLMSSFFVGGLFVSFIAGLSKGLVNGLIIGLIFASLTSLTTVLELSKTISSISYLKTAYQRIYGGFVVNLLITILLSVTIFFFILLLNNFVLVQYLNDSELRTIFASSLIPSITPIYRFVFTPLILHLYLRLCFWYEGAMPLKYATFLDYAANDQEISKNDDEKIGLRILEKDGGFWRFRHQNLQEYFANLKDE